VHVHNGISESSSISNYMIEALPILRMARSQQTLTAFPTPCWRLEPVSVASLSLLFPNSASSVCERG
jgi:hypothetical protein